jgi:PRTRC system protein E
MALLTELAKLGSDVQWAIFATVNSPESMVVSVRVTSGEVKSKQNAKIGALNFRGTPQELDDMLVSQLANHVPKAKDFFTNCKEFNASVDEAQKQLQEKKSTQSQTGQTQASVAGAGAKNTKPKDPKTLKFEAAMKVVEDLEKDEKYGQALAKIPSVKDFPQFKDQIEAKFKQLKNKHAGYSQFDMFGTEAPPKADSPSNDPGPSDFEPSGDDDEELQEQSMDETHEQES